MRVMEGGICCPIANTKSYYVATAVDGVSNPEDNTELVRMTKGSVKWNKTIVKTFDTLEPTTPIIISLTMYNKKTFKSGFGLVGTAQIALLDLVRILNKPAVSGKLGLNVKKNHLRSSYLVVELQLRCQDAQCSTTTTHHQASTHEFHDIVELRKTSSADHTDADVDSDFDDDDDNDVLEAVGHDMGRVSGNDTQAVHPPSRETSGGLLGSFGRSLGLPFLVAVAILTIMICSA